MNKTDKESDYEVLARKFRPQTFQEVVGQDPIVTTLKNALETNRLCHAYIFCGARGTGKTTLARILAKAINCEKRTSSCEPCNVCTSCKDITSGHSLDVLEIDGASHRGIEDIRQINDTVSYAAALGKNKIYIIDEVHMLTKEAFNALLKTLEEPPAKVKFLFATTEPNKILPTILSRCQIFNLHRIPLEKIVDQLQKIALQLHLSVEPEALWVLAKRAEGGLRDAESLFDQVRSFEEGIITAKSVSQSLGLVSKDLFFSLDQAGKRGDLAYAFTLSKQVFSEGKDLNAFTDALLEHFRNLLLVKLSGKNALNLDQEAYLNSSLLYETPQLLNLIDQLIEAQNKIRTAPNQRIALEALLLRILRSHNQITVESLVEKLSQLQNLLPKEHNLALETKEEIIPSSPLLKNIHEPLPSFQIPQITSEVQKEDSQLKGLIIDSKPDQPSSTPPLPFKNNEPSLSSEHPKKQDAKDFYQNENIKPTKKTPLSEQARQDTLLQFAAVELEGTLTRNQ